MKGVVLSMWQMTITVIATFIFHFACCLSDEGFLNENHLQPNRLISSGNAQYPLFEMESQKNRRFTRRKRRSINDDWKKNLTTNEDFIVQHLEITNKFRSLHGVLPLDLDYKLCAEAEEWAKELVKRSEKEKRPVLVHSWKFETGENIYAERNAKNITLDGPRVALKWYSQCKDHTWENNFFSGKSARFTQLVWKDTKKIGIGKATSVLQNLTVVVARYLPCGNWGYHKSFEENVFPQVNNKEKCYKSSGRNISTLKIENSSNNETKDTSKGNSTINTLRKAIPVGYNTTHRKLDYGGDEDNGEFKIAQAGRSISGTNKKLNTSSNHQKKKHHKHRNRLDTQNTTKAKSEGNISKIPAEVNKNHTSEKIESVKQNTTDDEKKLIHIETGNDNKKEKRENTTDNPGNHSQLLETSTAASNSSAISTRKVKHKNHKSHHKNKTFSTTTKVPQVTVGSTTGKSKH